MAESQSKGKTIQTWVQTVFIIIAGLWGIYTFIYKEIRVPRAAPINISVNLDLKEIGTQDAEGGEQGELSAIEMKISARNPSSRPVYLLSNMWFAEGVKIARAAGETFLPEVNGLFISGTPNYMTRHAKKESSEVLATGILFSDHVLKPNETIATTIVFHVPAKQFDLIQVTAQMPTVAKEKKAVLVWAFDGESFAANVYQANAEGKPEGNPLPQDKVEAFLTPLEGQSAISRAQLSLWQPQEAK
jgi:hypothetical protein